MTDEDKTKESPVTDKALEEGDKKPPEMGKGEELPEAGKVEEKVEEEELSPELEATMKRKGFKTPAELAKAYDASEKKQTELEKDARLRSLIPQDAPPRPREELPFKKMPELTKEPFDMSKEEFEVYQKQREEVVEHNLTIKYQEAKKDEEWDRQHAEAMRTVNFINKDNPNRFEELKPILNDLHVRYPKASLAEIHPMAEDMEKTQGLQKKEGFIKEVFGPDTTQDDIDKLKTVMSKARPAIVSDAGGAGAKGGGKKKPDDVIWDNIAKADLRRDS